MGDLPLVPEPVEHPLPIVRTFQLGESLKLEAGKGIWKLEIDVDTSVGRVPTLWWAPSPDGPRMPPRIEDLAAWFVGHDQEASREAPQ